MRPCTLVLMAGLFGAATPVIAAESKLDDAVAFGALEAVEAASLSVDGRKLIYVGADTDDRAIAVLVDLTSWNSRKVAFADGRKVQFSGCDWSANDRVVCTLFGVQREMGVIMPLVRTVAMDADGKNQVFLGQRDTLSQYGKRQVDGEVVDWLNGRDGMVLMSRTYLPEKSVARLTARTVAGLGVDRIDTRTGKAATIERPGEDVVGYISDGMGNIRIMTTTRVGGQGYMRGVDDYFYRRANERAWHPLGSYISDGSRGRDDAAACNPAGKLTEYAAGDLVPRTGDVAAFGADVACELELVAVARATQAQGERAVLGPIRAAAADTLRRSIHRRDGTVA